MRPQTLNPLHVHNLSTRPCTQIALNPKPYTFRSFGFITSRDLTQMMESETKERKQHTKKTKTKKRRRMTTEIATETYQRDDALGLRLQTIAPKHKEQPCSYTRNSCFPVLAPILNPKPKVPAQLIPSPYITSPSLPPRIFNTPHILYTYRPHLGSI